jgi:prepilin-type processing-associated H-X9-DG protein/prepilin-type N-terminal cleavage/methylation domain-containing protein
MKTSKAFTLIELLVVIAIISLLVSILIPSLQKAKELAKGVVCMSNARSLSLSITLYTDMYNETLPNCDAGGFFCHWSFKLVQAGVLDSARGTAFQGAWLSGTPSSAFVGIQVVNAGQVTNPLHCPSITEEEISQKSYIVAFGSPQGVMGSFSPGDPYPVYSTLSMFPSLSRVVATYDAKNFHMGSNYASGYLVGPIWGAVWTNETGDSMGVFLSERHSGGANCLYLDGHVENNVLEDIYYQDMVPPRSCLPR